MLISDRRERSFLCEQPSVNAQEKVCVDYDRPRAIERLPYMLPARLCTCAIYNCIDCSGVLFVAGVALLTANPILD